MAGDAKFTNVTAGTLGGGYRIVPEEIEALVIPPNWSRWKGDEEKDEEWAAFVESIATKGQLQPVLVRKDAQGNMQLVDGRRRRRAILEINGDLEKWNKSEALPLLVRLVKMSNDEAIVANLEGNRRKALTAVDLASYARELDRMGWKRQKVAASMHLSESRVGQLLDLWQHDHDVLDLVHDGVLPETLARKMLGLAPSKIKRAVERIKGGDKPRAVMAEVVEAKRASGKKVGRTLAELKAEIAPLVKDPKQFRAIALAEWLAGTSDDLGAVFAEDVEAEEPPKKAAGGVA